MIGLRRRVPTYACSTLRAPGLPFVEGASPDKDPLPPEHSGGTWASSDRRPQMSGILRPERWLARASA